jgi:hypothetical protein
MQVPCVARRALARVSEGPEKLVSHLMYIFAQSARSRKIVRSTCAQVEHVRAARFSGTTSWRTSMVSL